MCRARRRTAPVVGKLACLPRRARNDCGPVTRSARVASTVVGRHDFIRHRERGSGDARGRHVQSGQVTASRNWPGRRRLPRGRRAAGPLQSVAELGLCDCAAAVAMVESANPRSGVHSRRPRWARLDGTSPRRILAEPEMGAVLEVVRMHSPSRRRPSWRLGRASSCNVPTIRCPATLELQSAPVSKSGVKTPRGVASNRCSRYLPRAGSRSTPSWRR